MTTYKVSKKYIVASILKNMPVLFGLILVCAAVITFIAASVKVFSSNSNDLHFSAFVFFTSLVILSLFWLAAGVIYRIYYCKSFVFSVGEDTVNTKGGILRRTDTTTSYGKIADVTISQDVFGRLLKYVTVEIKPVGTFFSDVSFLVLMNLMQVR